MAGVKRAFDDDTMHLEVCHADDEANIAYCTKESTRVAGPWELGNRVGNQGQRKDIERICEAVKAGKTDHEMAIENPSDLFKYGSHIRNLRRALNVPPMRDGVEVFVYIGPTRCGKTWFAYHGPLSKSLFRVTYSPNRVWWDGYDGEDCIFFDEFTGSNIVPITQMLQWLDPYPTRVEIKGDFTSARWTKVIIASNNSVASWYSAGFGGVTVDQVAALQRRLTHVYPVQSREDVWKTVGMKPDGTSLLPAPMPLHRTHSMVLDPVSGSTPSATPTNEETTLGSQMVVASFSDDPSPPDVLIHYSQCP